MAKPYRDYGPQGACAPKTAWALATLTALFLVARPRRVKRGAR